MNRFGKRVLTSGSNGEHDHVPYRTELRQTASNRVVLLPHFAVQHISAGQGRCGVLVHTEEVTGSIPVSPTINICQARAHGLAHALASVMGTVMVAAMVA